MNTYKVSVTLPITYLAEVEAEDVQEAFEKAGNEAINAPILDWNDDFSRAEYSLLDD